MTESEKQAERLLKQLNLPRNAELYPSPLLQLATEVLADDEERAEARARVGEPSERQWDDWMMLVDDEPEEASLALNRVVEREDSPPPEKNPETWAAQCLVLTLDELDRLP